ncbi:MAPEG family protein [Laspinema olomoucense]|uniref:MAPEG family protein n=1 Tax=Laspinema olomoucense D3b TaxID=2953688 RepID=A0ABT2N2N5_9CYAN|nr:MULTISPECIES: MAPEG family protein [unclassified Laspinema]MCT7970541.1 MAPEG family protein [Laspinema sp. D3d]MCT7976958.1 MAPEG family protein [Laspinema sp. D3b]MCT7989594.1 MAPEG family protein [Laspinema sp. D3a]
MLSPWPSLVTISALIVYFVVTINVGRARAKYKIIPPAMSGNPDFERVVRVHENTLEQLISFLPALWIFSAFVSPVWAAAIGGVWVVGRIIYAWGYYQAAEKRGIGFAISSLTNMILIIGSLVGIILNVTQSGLFS